MLNRFALSVDKQNHDVKMSDVFMFCHKVGLTLSYTF